jgi:hypothetical protein
VTDLVSVVIADTDRRVIISLLADVQGDVTYPCVWRALTSDDDDDRVVVTREHAEELYQFVRNHAHGGDERDEPADARIATACARVSVAVGRALCWITTP